MQEKILRQEYVAVAPMTKLSAVNSGGSPNMQAGKSLIGMLLTNWNVLWVHLVKSKMAMRLRILWTNIRHDVLIEEFQYQRNAIGEYQVLWHEFKLIYVINFEMFQIEQ